MKDEPMRRSFGIGGAGNIRTREEALIPGAQTAYEAARERRQSSAATSSSAGSSGDAAGAGGRGPGRRESVASRLSAALGGIFRRSGSSGA